MTNNEGLIEINCDTIRDLKNRGKAIEAYNLLNAFREQCKKQKKVDSLIFRREVDKKRKIIKKNLGLCSWWSCNDKIYKYGLCKNHYKKYLSYRKRDKRNYKRKSNKELKQEEEYYIEMYKDVRWSKKSRNRMSRVRSRATMHRRDNILSDMQEKDKTKVRGKRYK